MIVIVIEIEVVIVIVIVILLFVKNEANPVHLVRLGEWDVTNQGKDCVGNRCLPPVQDFNVTLADFTIHPDFKYDRNQSNILPRKYLSSNLEVSFAIKTA